MVKIGKTIRLVSLKIFFNFLHQISVFVEKFVFGFMYAREDLMLHKKKTERVKMLVLVLLFMLNCYILTTLCIFYRLSDV